MPLRDYEAVWNFTSPAEPGVRLDLEVFDGRRGDTVRVRRTMLGGLIRRTVLAIQIESDRAGDFERAVANDTSTMRNAAAIARHLGLRGWTPNDFQANTTASNILAPSSLSNAAFTDNEFRQVGEQLPFELRASMIEHRASRVQTCTAPT